MTLVEPDVWKIVYKQAKKDAEAVDLARHRVTYHRNLYMEAELHPFDSTYLNHKAGIINPHETGDYLEGILIALSTMKVGEQSYFIISHRKMFKEQGCEPRVASYADILCDLKVVKVEEIGDKFVINKLNDKSAFKTFKDAKEIYQETRLCAKNLFQNGKLDAALKKYLQVKQMLEFCKTETNAENDEKNEMLYKTMTNMAICYNLKEQPNKTLALVRQIEKLVDINCDSKLLFIKGKALRMLSEHAEAKTALIMANRLTPFNTDISRELIRLDADVKNYKEMMAKFSKNLMIK